MSTRPLLLDLTYEIVTPLFMSGVDQSVPDLRVPSIRGAVRAWYRAIDPGFLNHEPYTFGAADHKHTIDDEGYNQQSPFLLRIVKAPTGEPFVLERAKYDRPPFSNGRPPNKTNGILYTGFSLLESFNLRRAFPAGTQRHVQSFTLRLVFPRPVYSRHRNGDLDARLYYRILGAFWALGHLGGLGSRCNRGWGSVQLTGLKAVGTHVPPAVNDVLKALQPASTRSVEAWLGDVGKTLATLRSELGARREGHALATPHLGPGATISVANQPSPEWDTALEPMGASLQAFRRDVARDRQEVMRQLLKHQRASSRAQAAAVALRAAPRRVSFGLPLTFRFGIVPKAAKELGLNGLRPDVIEFSPDDATRHPGLLRLRVVRLAKGCHAVAVRLQGDPPGSKVRDDARPSSAPEVAIKGVISAGKTRDEEAQRSAAHDDAQGLPLHPAGDGDVDHFLRTLTPHTTSLQVPR